MLEFNSQLWKDQKRGYAQNCKPPGTKWAVRSISSCCPSTWPASGCMAHSQMVVTATLAPTLGSEVQPLHVSGDRGTGGSSEGYRGVGDAGVHEFPRWSPRASQGLLCGLGWALHVCTRVLPTALVAPVYRQDRCGRGCYRPAGDECAARCWPRVGEHRVPLLTRPPRGVGATLTVSVGREVSAAQRPLLVGGWSQCWCCQGQLSGDASGSLHGAGSEAHLWDSVVAVLACVVVFACLSFTCVWQWGPHSVGCPLWCLLYRTSLCV